MKLSNQIALDLYNPQIILSKKQNANKYIKHPNN
jgi:hypothetical protein